jgi:hypothetical protein
MSMRALLQRWRWASSVRVRWVGEVKNFCCCGKGVVSEGVSGRGREEGMGGKYFHEVTGEADVEGVFDDAVEPSAFLPVGNGDEIVGVL